MNSVLVTYDCQQPIGNSKVLLNGEDVTNDTKYIMWTPTGAMIVLLDTPRLDENKRLKMKAIQLDEIKVN